MRIANFFPCVKPIIPVVLDESLFADFCNHLSASLNVIDVVYKTRQLASPEFDANKDDPIVLAFWDESMAARLIQMKYPEFVQACVRNLRLLKSCTDVFLSEVERHMVELFEQAFEYIAPQARVEVTDKGLVVHTSAILADLIICPIGRLHHETLQSLDYFSKMLAAVDNNAAKLFLNAKAPTPESQYIQIWVAHKLGIPIAPPTGNIMVV